MILLLMKIILIIFIHQIVLRKGWEDLKIIQWVELQKENIIKNNSLLLYY
jgi:hypothetical protein